MRKNKRLIGAICVMAITASISVTASAADVNTAQAENTQPKAVMSADFNMDSPAASTRKAGWKSYSSSNLTGGGTWFGGVKNDGTLCSQACSKSYRSKVYVKTGKDTAKRWSGWAEPGNLSYKSATATLTGNTCGYDLDN